MPEQSSSFIPKAGTGPVRPTRGVRRIYLLSYASNIVFFSVLFAVIGIYIYAALVDRSLTEVKSQLETAQSRFSVNDIERVKKLDERLKTAATILNESTAPSELFAAVEKVVASNIVFTAMTYKQLPNKQFALSLTGQAEDFDQIIKQSEIIQDDDLLGGAKITNYDYSLAGDQDAPVLTGQATLTFVFNDMSNISEISYNPTVTEKTVDTALVDDVNTTTPADDTIVGTSSPVEAGNDQSSESGTQ